MSKVRDLNESLSSFMDGELDEHAGVLDNLKNCNETKACWLRYHMIRDTLRDSRRPANLSADFSSRIMRALETEPVIMNRAASFRRHMFKPAAGLAIAASVAAITVFSMRTFYMTDTQSDFNVAANSATEGAVSRVADRPQDDDLNSYLLEHMEHSAAGVQGMMPYVRLAGFEDSQ
jgi:negative regulator of sigma E activity